MWIPETVWNRLFESLGDVEREARESREAYREAQGENTRLKVENERLNGRLSWAMLRLNAVEKERAQLISAAIGVKVSIPEFQPVEEDDHGRALHEMPDLSTIGGDAHEDPAAVLSGVGQELGVSYELMPGYRAPR